MSWIHFCGTKAPNDMNSEFLIVMFFSMFPNWYAYIFFQYQSSLIALVEPKEDYSDLAPNQRRKKLQQRIDEINTRILQETATRDGLMKMKGVYEQNRALGDPLSIEGQLTESGQRYIAIQILSLVCQNWKNHAQLFTTANELGRVEPRTLIFLPLFSIETPAGFLWLWENQKLSLVYWKEPPSVDKGKISYCTRWQPWISIS